MRRLNERDKKKNRSTAKTFKAQERRKNVQCMKMHKHVMCKNKLHHGQKPNPT